MFSSTKLSAALCQNSKRFSSSCVRPQVFVSQSRDLLSNVALEDWAAKNTDLQTKSLLILSNNVTKASGVDIKATLVDAQSFWKAKELDELVLSSLPADLALKSIPGLDVNHDSLDAGSKSYSIHLNLTEDVKTKTVLRALETIGNKFLCQVEAVDSKNDGLAHINLVRPDDGWFPGLGEIRAELEEQFDQVKKLKTQELKIKERKKKISKDYSHIQSSFGQ